MFSYFHLKRLLWNNFYPSEELDEDVELHDLLDHQSVHFVEVAVALLYVFDNDLVDDENTHGLI